MLLCAAIGTAMGCGGERVSGPADPGASRLSVATPNVSVGVTVGSPVAYDATQGGTTFTVAGGDSVEYRITFAGNANGLLAEGGMVVGQPLSPTVTWATIVATNGQGRTSSDRFAMVAFAPGLTTPTLQSTPFRYSDEATPLPAHFRGVIDGRSVGSTDNTPADNPITDPGAALGRVLFYDPRLSANDSRSCGGCHSLALGFSDRPQQSIGFAGKLTRRHSPALANARFYARGHFFWDERAATLEDQTLHPIQDPVEMGLTLENLTAKLKVTPYYPALFSAAFGSPEVSSERVSRAIAQFIRSMVSANSRFDRAFTPEGTPNFAAFFTPQELEGEALFRSTGCAECHGTVAQVSDSVHNNGLDIVSADTGAGRGGFKAPSLRNVAVRPRFMHDGRFTSLEQVVSFYNSGVQPNPDLDSRLKGGDGSPKRLNLTAAQQGALVAFLQTLTDSVFLNAPRFADPFELPGAPPPPPATGGANVTMQAIAYHPRELTVAPGTVVTWTNLDNIEHSASFTSAQVGTTPIFSEGSQQLTLPTIPGRYGYQCAVHGSAMRGTIIVE
jgi:cytochrome c peroxidase